MRRKHHHRPSIAYALLEAAAVVAAPIAIAGLAHSSSWLLADAPTNTNEVHHAQYEHAVEDIHRLARSELARIAALAAECDAMAQRVAHAAEEGDARARVELAAVLARIDALAAECDAMAHRVALAAKESDDQQEKIQWLQSQLAARMITPSEAQLRENQQNMHGLLSSRSDQIRKLETRLSAYIALECELGMRIHELEAKQRQTQPPPPA